MTKPPILLIAAATLFAGGPSRSFTGVITDSMCIANHKMMHISPDSKCILECVKASRSVKFVLFDGKSVYQLSDQQMPAKFAGRKVTITGQASGNSIQVVKIAEAK
ncbi:MAG: hypothetical protein P4L56_04985 [Candidatus Sulfopaludibacter sp.]|nr:hypothetical protein [Candidatus Sulfopaludibacter sp.]